MIQTFDADSLTLSPSMKVYTSTYPIAGNAFIGVAPSPVKDLMESISSF